MNLALTKDLVNADLLGNIALSLTESVKMSAAGFIHLRALVERLEHLHEFRLPRGS